MMWLLLTLLAVSTPAAPPTLKLPLLLTVRQTVGMSPFTLRVKVKAEAEGREVCVVVDGPEIHTSCRTVDGITWTQDWELRLSGCYTVFAVSGDYRTPAVKAQVIGLAEAEECY